MKICIVLSTRPEIIKLSPLIRKLKSQRDEFYLINTNQHFLDKMSKVFFDFFKISGKIYNVNPDKKSQATFFSDSVKSIAKILKKKKPSFLIVQGDTNTGLAGCMAASLVNRNLQNRDKIKIVHIESGLRSFDDTMPEEINRKIIDQMSHILFPPTKFDFNNLKKDNCLKFKKTFIVGNTISDVLKRYELIADKAKILKKLKLKKKKYFLVTLHRPESVDVKKNIISLFKTFKVLNKKYNYPIIFPIHPRTKDKVKKLNLSFGKSIKIIEPLEYLDFLKLMKDSKLVLSDSGGLQEEASILGVPCVTLRTTTERQITLLRNVNIMAGYNQKKILNAVKKFHKKKIKKIKDFGNGNVTDKIYRKLKSLSKNFS
ncbi:UDP-N-acetylglucosamine 2-epimerase (non-hydrolyzing) [Pelagibacterales bacterium SAG-MED20]|nr:UDP-N-acetylglucosamine 2-epimerase (non-hydrolyzing) [Pelagibacterales bacterium SAG-MED20]